MDYELKTAQNLKIEIYDLNGNRIFYHAKETKLPPGKYEDRFSIPGIASGIYVVMLTGDTERAVKKVAWGNE